MPLHAAQRVQRRQFAGARGGSRAAQGLKDVAAQPIAEILHDIGSQCSSVSGQAVGLVQGIIRQSANSVQSDAGSRILACAGNDVDFMSPTREPACPIGHIALQPAAQGIEALQQQGDLHAGVAPSWLATAAQTLSTDRPLMAWLSPRNSISQGT